MTNCKRNERIKGLEENGGRRQTNGGEIQKQTGKGREHLGGRGNKEKEGIG